MANNILIAYQASMQNLTLTMASLASGSARECTAVDNTSNLFLDAMVYLALQLQSGTPSGDASIYVYAYGSADGSNYDDNATGSDAAITLRSPTTLKQLSVINAPTSGALTWKKTIPSVAAAFNGILPPKWGIVISNATGIAFNATEGNHTKQYRGVYNTFN